MSIPATALPRPPRKVTPDAFYAEYLPKLWGAWGGHVEWPDWRIAAEITIEAEPEVMHTVELAGGRLTGAAGPAKRPLIRVACDRAAWELAIYDVLPRVIRFLNKRLPDIHAQVARWVDAKRHRLAPEHIAGEPGELVVGFTDDAEDRGSYRVLVGGGTGPRAHIEARDEDLWALLESGGKFMGLLKSRALVDGDLTWVMRLAQLLERG